MSTVAPLKHVFICYAKEKKDGAWAEWMSFHLIDGGISTQLCWDLLAGQNYPGEWNKEIAHAEHVIVLFSSNFLAKPEYQSMWQAAYDISQSGRRMLIPIRIEDCELPPLLKGYVAINIFSMGEREALNELRGAITDQRVVQNLTQVPPLYPGDIQIPATSDRLPLFPGDKSSTIIELPYRANHFFTESQQIMKRIKETYKKKPLEPVALCGPKGSGKTQIANAFAYRYFDDYTDGIFWIKATTRSDWESSIQKYALHLFHEEQPLSIQTALPLFRKWLQTHDQWLLILDDVKDLLLVLECTPPRLKGHILLTTCTQYQSSTATPIFIEMMNESEGALFLLRRATVIPSDAGLDQAKPEDVEAAMKIVDIMGGLPLALDQAGAWIESTGCSVQDYLKLCDKQLITLLKERGTFVRDLYHPRTVVEDWQDIFMELQKAEPVAAEILRFCAFFNPTKLPEEIIRRGGSKLGGVLASAATDPFLFQNSFRFLRQYSCLRRDNDEKTLTVHILTQPIIMSMMDESEQRKWAERALNAVVYACQEEQLPDKALCLRWLPQIRRCKELKQRWNLMSREAIQIAELEIYMEEILVQNDEDF